MKNTLKDLFLFTLIILSYLYILNNINFITKETLNILKISVTNIIPVLFPTLILSNILYSSKIPYIIEKFTKINPIYILSIITGSPTNAVILKNNKEDTTKILSLTTYPSLIFLYNYLIKIYNQKTTITLIILNIISTIILYFIIKPTKLYSNNINNISLPKIITDSGLTIINIISSCIFYAILPTTLINNTYLKSLLLSITEITSSLNNLSIINIPINIKLFFTVITISTTGLCIQTQILNIIKNINIKEYIKNRLLHLAIYLILVFIIILL
jgi:hypothetical protein